MTTTSNNDIAQAIYLSLKGKTGKSFSVSLKNVVRFLARRRLLSKSTEILFCLRKIINKENGMIEVKVASARKLGEKIKKSLVVFLKKRYAAKEVMLIEKLDEKLIAGVKVETNYEVINNTVKNKARQLQEYLTKSA